jgi:hypothetical protein
VSSAAFTVSLQHGNGRAPFTFPGPDCPLAVAVASGHLAAVGATEAGVGSLAGYLTRDFAIAMYQSGRVDVFLPGVSAVMAPGIQGD